MEEVKKHLANLATGERAAASAWFFKTGSGQYGEGDVFLGVTVPEQRKVAKQFQSLPLAEVVKLLEAPEHECRLTALFILVLQYQKADKNMKQKIVRLYLDNTKYVNNWDLVDSSASYILGNWLLDKKDRSVLQRLAKSKMLWERRIAIISTLEFIRFSQFGDTLALAEALLDDKHDLIHKAVGWSLREVGKRAPELLTSFLDKHAATMPRTALRYAIERFDNNTRKHYLNLKSV